MMVVVMGGHGLEKRREEGRSGMVTLSRYKEKEERVSLWEHLMGR